MAYDERLESKEGRREFLNDIKSIGLGALLSSSGLSGLLSLVGCEGGSTSSSSSPRSASSSATDEIISKGKELLEESKRKRREPIYVEHTLDRVNEGVHILNSIGGYRAEIDGDRAVFYAEGTDTCESYKRFYEKARMPDEFPVIYEITQRFNKEHGEWVRFGGFRRQQKSKR